MKTVKWLAAATLAVCLMNTVGFAVFMYQHTSGEFAKTFPSELNSKITEIKDIEHLRSLTVLLVNTDRTEKQAMNATFYSLVQWALTGFAGVAVFSAITLLAAYRATRFLPEGHGTSELGSEGKS